MSERQLAPRKTIERQARQAFVVEAALKLAASRGVENIRMEDIAEAADYTRRTLYAYFKSRDDILLLAFADDLHRRRDAQNRATVKVASGLEKLLAWGRAYASYVEENPDSRQLQAYWDYTGIEESRFSKQALEKFKVINESLAEDLREIFHLGIKDGSIRSDLNVDMTISQFLYSLRAVIHRAKSSTYFFASFDSDDYVDQFLELFRRGIETKDQETP